MGNSSLPRGYSGRDLALITRPSSNSEVKERVEFYLYPSLGFTACYRVRCASLLIVNIKTSLHYVFTCVGIKWDFQVYLE